MRELPEARWVPLDGPSPNPGIAFSGLPVGYAYFPDTHVRCRDPEAHSILLRFLLMALADGLFERVSGTRLERVTGVPAKFWRPTLLSLQRDNFLVEAEDGPAGSDDGEGVSYVSGPGNKELDAARMRRMILDVLLLTETGDVLVRTPNAGDAVTRLIEEISGPAGMLGYSPTPAGLGSRSLRDLLNEAAAEDTVAGLNKDLRGIQFDISGPAPVLTPVKLVSGMMDLTPEGAVPYLAACSGAGQDLQSGLLPQGWHKDAIPLSRIHGLASTLHARLEACRSPEALSRACSAAPDPVLAGLQCCSLGNWRLSSAPAVPHMLEFAFRDLTFHIVPQVPLPP